MVRFVNLLLFGAPLVVQAEDEQDGAGLLQLNKNFQKTEVDCAQGPHKCGHPTEEPQCKPVMCKMFCPNGWAKGEDGCDMCKCADKPKCKPIVCPMIHCSEGRIKDEDGCETCGCKPTKPTCKENFSCGRGLVAKAEPKQCEETGCTMEDCCDKKPRTTITTTTTTTSAPKLQEEVLSCVYDFCFVGPSSCQQDADFLNAGKADQYQAETEILKAARPSTVVRTCKLYGDPHIETFDGFFTTSQGRAGQKQLAYQEGTFYLVRSKNDDVDIQGGFDTQHHYLVNMTVSGAITGNKPIVIWPNGGLYGASKGGDIIGFGGKGFGQNDMSEFQRSFGNMVKITKIGDNKFKMTFTEKPSLELVIASQWDHLSIEVFMAEEKNMQAGLCGRFGGKSDDQDLQLNWALLVSGSPPSTKAPIKTLKDCPAQTRKEGEVCCRKKLANLSQITTTTITTTTSSCSEPVAQYKQCGGKGYSGSTCCAAGLTCGGGKWWMSCNAK